MSQPNHWISSTILLSVLKQHPKGMSEHALLLWLKEKNHIQLEPDEFHDMMKLFRVHFLLFHRLYQLQDELHASKQGSLSIHSLRIHYLPYYACEDALILNDPLRVYYLDLNNLKDTNEVDLEEMLAKFWTSLGHLDAQAHGYQKRQDALKLLDLDTSATDKEIKHAWRRLAMQHHPDRGGDEEQIKALNQAVSVLLSR